MTTNISDFLNGDGVTTNPDSAMDALIAHMIANPGETYQSKRTAIYKVTFSAKTIPGNITLRLQGARFLWTGDIYSTANSVITLADGLDVDTLRLEIVTGSRFRRAIHASGNIKSSLIELIAQSQIQNYGSNLDAGIRIAGNFNDIDEIKVKNVDRAAIIYGDAITHTGTRIGFTDIENYVTGLQTRNVSKCFFEKGRITGRSSNAVSDPGNNGILTSGISESKFGEFLVKDSGEHGIRIGGNYGAGTETYDVSFISPTIKNSGQCGLKIWNSDLTNPVKRINVSGAMIVDCGDNGDGLGFNDFGMMIQNVQDSQFNGCTVTKDELAYSAYDSVYISSAVRTSINGLVTYGAQRNGLRISEYNNNGLDSGSTNTLHVAAPVIENSGADGVLIECPTAKMRDISITNANIIACVNGINWAGSASKAVQPCFFSAVIRSNSADKFVIPATANLKAVDLMA